MIIRARKTIITNATIMRIYGLSNLRCMKYVSTKYDFNDAKIKAAATASSPNSMLVTATDKKVNVNNASSIKK